jgi:hypothetical protein
VFDSSDETFDLIDEAWRIKKRDGLLPDPNDQFAFDIPMDRPVGIERYLDANGVEQTRVAEHIRVVLIDPAAADTAIRTAYPVFR